MTPVSPIIPGSQPIEIVLGADQRTTSLAAYKIPGLIYVARNTVNGKLYVGQTISGISRRVDGHKRSAKLGSKSAFHNALRVHGISNFEFLVICFCFGRAEINQAERFFINRLNSRAPFGYNLTSGGDSFEMDISARTKISLSKLGKKRPNMTGVLNPRFGKPLPENVRLKLSIATTKQMTPERRAELSRQHMGIKHTEATKLKISDNSKRNNPRGPAHPWHGYQYTDSERQEISRRFKGKPKSEEHRAKIAAALAGRKKPWMIGNTLRRDSLRQPFQPVNLQVVFADEMPMLVEDQV